MGVIVVGVDGSAGSIAALRWAARQAQLQGAHIRAVQVWEYPVIALAPSPIGSAVPPAEEMQVAAEEALATTLEAAELPGDIDVATSVIEGSAAKVLLHEVEELEADMLVVGARGHGLFAGRLLGSVSSRVVNHARVPTVVVPYDDED